MPFDTIATEDGGLGGSSVVVQGLGHQAYSFSPILTVLYVAYDEWFNEYIS